MSNQPCPRCGKQNPADIHTCTPLALKLADELMEGMSDEHWSQLNADAAAELRRLHAENEALRGMSFDTKRDMETETLLRQALAVIDSMEQNHGNLWQVPYEPEQLDAIATALRERLGENT